VTETKTFNTKTDEGSLQFATGRYFYDGNEFPTDEWDMEVTFTKKVKPLAVGDVVRVDIYAFDSWDRVHNVTILAIDAGTYWVRTDSGDYHTLGADDLDR
jgi:hypothetical protein